MSNNFKVGDRVELVRDAFSAKAGMKGTIKFDDETNGIRYAVEFDEPFENGHHCDGHTKPGHGYWVSTSVLKPIQKFEVGQVYKVTGDRPQSGNIIKILENGWGCSYSWRYKTIRGNSLYNEFDENTPFANSLVLLTGSQIGEEIKKWDADHAPKPAQEYIEVDRDAKAGEKIKIIAACMPCGYKNGDVATVDKTFKTGLFATFTDRSVGVFHHEYVVLEPKHSVKEVDRDAEVGEYIKIVHTTPNLSNSLYENGDIFEVVSNTFCPGDVKVDTKSKKCVYVDRTEYVVLEGYNPESAESPAEPQKERRKAKVAEAKRIVLDTIREQAERGNLICFDTVGISYNNFRSILISKGSESVYRNGDLTVKGVKVSESKCGPNDEPNEWIGKCVAICKLLGKPIPRFIMDNGTEKRFSFEKAQQLCDDGDIVTIRCKDQTEGDLLKAELEKLGVLWKSGEEPTRFDFFDDGYFVVQNGKKLSFNRMKGHDKFVEFSDCFTEI